MEKKKNKEMFQTNFISQHQVNKTLVFIIAVLSQPSPESSYSDLQHISFPFRHDLETFHIRTRHQSYKEIEIPPSLARLLAPELR